MNDTTRRISAVLAGLVLTAAALPVPAADPAAAERQFRIARRLAAEGSPDAAEALQKVIELDPAGVLADDALVEQALLEHLPRWPEDLGGLDSGSGRVALKLLEVVADQYGGADRLSEARYYHALLLLEPLPTFDESAARFDLITVATNPDASDWTLAARYTGAWLATRLGHHERAVSAYSRLLVDAPGSPTAARAAVGLARLMLRDGRPGRAAHLLQQAVESEAEPGLHADQLRQLAIRLIEARRGLGDIKVVVPETGVKALAGMAATPSGIVIGDTRSGEVLQLGGRGGTTARWSLEDLQLVAADGLGRVYAATTDRIHRLQPDEPATAVAVLGEFSQAIAISVESTGRVWLLDRKGERVGKLDPGKTQPAVFAEERGAKFAALHWDGRRLLTIDTKGKDLVQIGTDTTVKRLGLQGLQRPEAIAVDAAGRIAVLDAKDAGIVLFEAGGAAIARLECKPAGITRPSAISFGLDGSLNVFDASSGAWVKLQ